MISEQDKRRFERQQALLDVRIAREKLSSEKPTFDECIGKTINLSGGGMYLKVKEVMRIDDVVRVHFLPPNTFDFFSGVGRVVRSALNSDRSFNVALEFVDTPESDKKLLDYYLHR